MAGDKVTDGPVCAIDGICCGAGSPCCDEYAGPIEYRGAEPADLGKISELLSQSLLPLDGVAECIEEFIVAEASGSIVGSIAMERYGSYALLRSAAVSKPLRGRGVGNELVERLLREAASSHLTEIYLLTTTAESYFALRGFTVVDRGSVPAEIRSSPEFQFACPASATVMRCSLGAIAR